MSYRLYSFADNSVHEVENLFAAGSRLTADSRIVVDRRSAQSHTPLYGQWQRRTFEPKTYRWLPEWRRR
jgi:hypothetical protein